MKLLLSHPWKTFLSEYLTTPVYQTLENRVLQVYQEQTIFPNQDTVFEALNKCSPDMVKVIILGQDPYHKKGQAHGLAFSVPNEISPPPSLRNILKELVDDIGTYSVSNNLTPWAEQGVLLLNSILTVEEGRPQSHKHIGWEDYTDTIIKKISQEMDHCVFILWGDYAQKKSSYIDSTRHCIIKTVHPSPLSAYRGFFGSKPFSKANHYLKTHGKKEIIW